MKQMILIITLGLVPYSTDIHAQRTENRLTGRHAHTKGTQIDYRAGKHHHSTKQKKSSHYARKEAYRDSHKHHLGLKNNHASLLTPAKRISTNTRHARGLSARRTAVHPFAARERES